MDVGRFRKSSKKEIIFLLVLEGMIVLKMRVFEAEKLISMIRHTGPQLGGTASSKVWINLK